MEHFKSSFIVTAVGLTLALFIGGVSALYIVSLLAVLEISLSFDNAVVNAKILETMEPKWQKRFITWGMVVAVFGMRFLFPIIIVSVASGLGILETFNLALNNPYEYHETLVSVEKLIFAFGGSFLLMVFLSFIFDTDREEKWINIIENSKILEKMGRVSSSNMMISLMTGLIVTSITASYEIAVAYFTGILLYSIISSVDEFFNTNGVRSGMMGLLYLEVLDASFSFDGVIGSFALSSDIFIIMIGLGIGAMFVRSLTIYMLRNKTLSEYRYLEHGAHYAILALAIIMLCKIFFHIDEIIVGTLGVTFIAVSAYHSIKANRVEIRVEEKVK